MDKRALISGFADEANPVLAKQIEVLKSLDMSYIEMRGIEGRNIIHHTNDEIREIKKTIDDAGIALSSVGSPLGKHKLEEDFAPQLEDFKRGVEVAHMMGTRNIRMFSFYGPKGADRSTYEGQVFDRLEQFVKYAEANDVVLLHENEKDIYGEMAPECLKLMKTFGSDHFRACFDFANFLQAKQDTLEAYELLKDYISYVHIKDACWETGRVVPAGTGDGNVEIILGKLFANGYNGFLSLEPHLFDFKGFEQLEQGKKTIIAGGDTKLTGEQAFALAHASLIKVLDRLA